MLVVGATVGVFLFRPYFVTSIIVWVLGRHPINSYDVVVLITRRVLLQPVSFIIFFFIRALGSSVFHSRDAAVWIYIGCLNSCCVSGVVALFLVESHHEDLRVEWVRIWYGIDTTVVWECRKQGGCMMFWVLASKLTRCNCMSSTDMRRGSVIPALWGPKLIRRRKEGVPPISLVFLPLTLREKIPYRMKQGTCFPLAYCCCFSENSRGNAAEIYEMA